jgi:hypothetical protein
MVRGATTMNDGGKGRRTGQPTKVIVGKTRGQDGGIFQEIVGPRGESITVMDRKVHERAAKRAGEAMKNVTGSTGWRKP